MSRKLAEHLTSSNEQFAARFMKLGSAFQDAMQSLVEEDLRQAKPVPTRGARFEVPSITVEQLGLSSSSGELSLSPNAPANSNSGLSPSISAEQLETQLLHANNLSSKQRPNRNPLGPPLAPPNTPYLPADPWA